LDYNIIQVLKAFYFSFNTKERKISLNKLSF